MVKQAQYLPVNQDEDVVEVVDSVKASTDHDRKVYEFASAMSDLGENSEILVKRQTGGGKDPMEHIGYFEPDEYTYGQLVEHLRNNYGGGLYRIYLRSNGRNKGNSLVRIAEPKTGTVKTPTVGSEVNQVLATTLAAIERSQRELAESLRGAPQKTTMEMMQEMLMMMDLMERMRGPREKEVNPIDQLKNTVGLLSDLGLNIGGLKEPEEEGFGTLIEKLAPVFVEGMKAPSQPKYKPNPTTPPTGDKTMFKEMAMKQGLKMLVKAATNNAQPEIYSEMILDQFDPELVKSFLLAPDSRARLIALSPQIAQYGPWFDELGEHLKGALGMASKYADLYGDGDSDINEATVESEHVSRETDEGEIQVN